MNYLLGLFHSLLGDNMKTERYVKLIFEKGSVIFRKVTSYNKCDKNNLMIITFEDKTASAFDMMFFYASLGKLVTIKDNIGDIKNAEVVDIECDL